MTMSVNGKKHGLLSQTGAQGKVDIFFTLTSVSFYKQLIIDLNPYCTLLASVTNKIIFLSLKMFLAYKTM